MVNTPNTYVSGIAAKIHGDKRGIIYLNTFYLDKMTTPNLAGTLVLEWAHTIQAKTLLSQFVYSLTNIIPVHCSDGWTSATEFMPTHIGNVIARSLFNDEAARIDRQLEESNQRRNLRINNAGSLLQGGSLNSVAPAVNSQNPIK